MSPSPTPNKTHLFLKGQTVALLGERVPEIHHTLSVLLILNSLRLPIFCARQSEFYLNLDKSHWCVICTVIYTPKSTCKWVFSSI